MNPLLMEELHNEIYDFQIQTNRFLQNEMSVHEFKGYSGGFGSYAQRGGRSFMLRLRMDQGVMTKEKLLFICDTCRQYGITKTHVTTCQTIQLHDLTGKDLPTIMHAALDNGIICRGGGGDYPRNVMCSPLSGVEDTEYFDVSPYAQKVSEYLLSILHKYSLPRKFKVAFSNSDKNQTHATFRDLGFCANEDQSFDVYCAGGLGKNPKMGVNVAHHIPGSQLLFHVSTMLLLFMEFGNYENRRKARTRYMQDSLGIETLKKEYQKRLQQSLVGENLTIHVKQRVYTKLGKPYKGNHHRVISLKQAGMYAVYYHPIGGNLTPTKLEELYACIKNMEDVEIRITPQQGLYIINLNGGEVEQVLQVSKDSARTTFEESTSCIGAHICQLGIRDSQKILNETIMYIRKKNYPNHVLPKIFISGCPNSCGTNQIGILGFQGTTLLIDKQPTPAYLVSFKGNDTRENACFGDLQGALLERDMSSFLEAIADAVCAHSCDFHTWILHHENECMRIINRYIK